MSGRISQIKLNKMLVEDLSDYIISNSDIQRKPLILELGAPFNIRAKIYLFNCTCPQDGKRAGGRRADEYKSQLIIENQRRGEPGRLDDSDGTYIFIIGYAVPLDSEDRGVYVIWDTECHKTFSYSANLQVKLDALLQTICEDVVIFKKRNGEKVILARRGHIKEAIEKRMACNLIELIE